MIMFELKRPRVELDKQFLLLSSTAVLIFMAFFWHLSSLTGGLSPAENLSRINSHSLSAILNNPINAPHTALQYLLFKAHLDGIFFLRLASVIFGLMFLASFYKISKHWFGRFVASVTTLLLGMTPIFILASRNATPDIMYLSPLLVGALYFWLTRMAEPAWYAYLLFILAGCLVVYTPGLVWLLALGLFAIRNNLKPLIKLYDIKIQLASAFIILACLAPLVAGLIKHPELVRHWLLLPDNLWHLQVLENVGWAFLSVFWHSSQHHDLQIDTLPITTNAQLFLSIFGIYALWSRAQDKLIYLAATLLLIVLGSGLANNFGFLTLSIVPVILLAAAGLRYLHMEWQGVFPRNPLPRGLALFLIALVSLASINYGIRYSLLAWPNTVSTKATYVIK